MYKIMHDYRVVVGIEFGTTHSGFGYAHKENKENINVNFEWPSYYVDIVGTYKVPTVLSYDDEYKNVQSWGYKALAELEINFTIESRRRKPVELFKLLLGKMEIEPPLPHEKAISDYLHELGRVVKEYIYGHWRNVDLHKNVLIILTVPDNYKFSIWTMRECAFKAGLLNDRYSQNLKVITESEATALFCMKNLKTHNISVGDKFIVVECGDDKVNLTTRMLLIDEILSVILEKTEDNCGGSFVYQEFLKCIEHKVGSSAINLFSEKHKPELQYLQSAFERELIRFTGDQSECIPLFELIDLEEYCPSLMNYCEGEYRDNMIEDEWTIKLKFDDVKAMFDLTIEKIIQLIDSQLRSCNDDCFALSLVGNFAESRYLQLRIEETFNKRVQFISHIHKTAIIRGAVQYGLNYDNMSISNIKFQLSQTIKKFEGEKKKLQEENKLYNNLKGNYNDLTIKYNEEANQHQIIVENLKNEIKEIEEKHSKNIHHLENQINDINQQYQNKIKLQEQRE
ncbi:hypothetical protein C1646_810066, partial [Rhizophagus diaphanus]